MILDNFLLLSGAISATGALTGQLVVANSVVSTNTIDLGPLTIGGNQAGDTGAGASLEVAFGILAAPLTATTVQFQLIQADDAALTSNIQVICQTDAFLIAALPIGTLVPLGLDQAAPYAPKRFIGVRYISAGATVTALSVTCTIVKDIQSLKNIYFKSGFLIA